ncbi:MAG: tRNA-dihydrouridine synthase family protein [Clostridia bacterium]|jgi:nifR3 family TIM-barrel protein|nr:tRNA-dihydrouridine synthase family protein [Clostridia bacterium]
MLEKINVAGMECANNVFLAPLAGYTNYPFRDMCRRLGAGLTFTEMVSCKGLLYGNEETKKLLYCGSESPKAVQIFGCDPAIMRTACEGEELAPFDLVDINMGCPMPKVIRNGEGSALMENFSLAEKVINECVKSGKRISVKFRTGIDEGHKVTEKFSKLCEGAGACMITVHGRTREKIYAGAPDYAEIAKAKNAVAIPVIANGGVWSKSDAEKMLSRTGADGVMIARAALYRPEIFADITGVEAPPVKELFLRQLSETLALYGERFACVFMRKMAAFYLKGKTGAAEMKRRLFAAQSTQEVAALAETAFSF